MSPLVFSPLVSIVVTCFNQGSYLETSVKSILSQTYPNIECIIVDDGSTDNTQEVAKLLMDLDSRVSYFYQKNGGLPSARNFGYGQAKGEWIQFLDADDWIHKDKIRFQLSHLNGDEGNNIVFYTDYERVFLDKNNQICNRVENIVGALTCEQMLQRLVVPDFLANSPFPSLQLCLLMHRSVFEKKLFDERLKALQDRDFALDLLIAGVTFIYTPMVAGYYTKHQGNRTNNWAYMNEYYILLYEIVCSKHQQLISFCQIGVDFFLREAIKSKNHQNFERLLKLVSTPFYFNKNQIKINNKFIFKIIYYLRLIIPSSMLFEEYRGYRSRKVISMFSRLINVPKKYIS